MYGSSMDYAIWVMWIGFFLDFVGPITYIFCFNVDVMR